MDRHFLDEQLRQKMDELAAAFDRYLEAERAAARICISAIRAQAMINLKHRLDPVPVEPEQQKACELALRTGAEFDALCREASVLLTRVRSTESHDTGIMDRYVGKRSA